MPATDPDESQPVFLVFLDALDEREIPKDSFLAGTYQAGIDSPVLNVTPCILGPMLTGTRAGEHNLIRPTPLYDEDIRRPESTHLVEEIPEDRNVLCHNLPFTAGVQPESGAILPSAPRANVNVQTPHLQVTRGDFSLVEVAKGNESVNQVFNGAADYIRQYFANVRNLARNGTYDVFVLSIRDLDSFTHFYDGAVRRELIRLLDSELQSLTAMGPEEPNPVLWFSDHGAREMSDTFRINQWLREQGYLDLDIHLQEWKRSGAPDGEVSEQIDLGSPYVQIDGESTAYSADAFDACVDVFDEVPEAAIEELRGDLEETGAFEAVYRKAELFDEEATHFEEIPELIPQRKPGLMVSGNVHPAAEVWNGEVDAHGYWRTGVHRRDAAVLGATRELNCEDRLTPLEVHDVLSAFIENNGEAVDREEEDLAPAKDRLEDLGYI